MENDNNDVKREKSSLGQCLNLFLIFFRLGIFTIGGGMAMIPLIQDEMVRKRKWLSEEECVDAIALCQSLPGVIAINMATYMGNLKQGIKGAFFSTLGVILPSYIIIIAVVELLENIGSNPFVLGALAGIKAAATGLIGYAAFTVGSKALKTNLQWVLGIITTVLVVICKVNPVIVIIGGIIVGIAVGKLQGGRR